MRIFDFGLLRLHGLFLVILVSLIGCATYVDLPVLEEQSYEINKSVMCPVCPGESIDQSQHPLAAQMRAIVANKLEQGWDEDAIKGFFVERYGPSVLLEPSRKGFNLVFWLAPPVVLLLGCFGLFLAIRSMSRKKQTGSTEADRSELFSNEERKFYLSQVYGQDGGQSLGEIETTNTEIK
tara:strand:+ start:104 stop:643 length:540 start_codon:yes stop_codon:yes gene_type:complete